MISLNLSKPAMNLYECPSLDVIACTCKKNAFDVMLGKDASFYPKSGLFRVEGVLLNARKLEKSVGKHLWHLIVYNPINVSKRLVQLWPARSLYRLSLRTTTGTGITALLSPTVNGVFTFIHIRRIQRAIRRYLQRNFETRAIPVAMALHPRLGAASCLSAVPVDLVCAIMCL